MRLSNRDRLTIENALLGLSLMHSIHAKASQANKLAANAGMSSPVNGRHIGGNCMVSRKVSRRRFVAGTAALVIDVQHCEATSHHSEGPPCGIGYTILPVAALGGAAVGTIVGVLLPVRHWRRIKVDELR